MLAWDRMGDLPNYELYAIRYATRPAMRPEVDGKHAVGTDRIVARVHRCLLCDGICAGGQPAREENDDGRSHGRT